MFTSQFTPKGAHLVVDVMDIVESQKMFKVRIGVGPVMDVIDIVELQKVLVQNNNR